MNDQVKHTQINITPGFVHAPCLKVLPLVHASKQQISGQTLRKPHVRRVGNRGTISMQRRHDHPRPITSHASSTFPAYFYKVNSRPYEERAFRDPAPRGQHPHSTRLCTFRCKTLPSAASKEYIYFTVRVLRRPSKSCRSTTQARRRFIHGLHPLHLALSVTD